jgi:hypothetical protein
VRVLEAVNRSIECKGLQIEIGNNTDYVHTNIDAPKTAASAIR